MINLNTYIQEALIKKDTKLRSSRSANWSILNAHKGDLIQWNGLELFFTYKGLKKFEYGSDAIQYYWAVNLDTQRVYDKPDTGVGSIAKPELYKLSSEKDTKRVYDLLMKKGYKWDENTLTLSKI